MAETGHVTADQEEMHVDPARAAELLANLKGVAARVHAAATSSRSVRLVAVSKLKPASDILALATAPSNPHLHFGENYVQELQHKASILPRNIRWHFIGGLQTNKCRPLAESIPNLWAVESVDTVKKADALERGRIILLERLQNEPPSSSNHGDEPQMSSRDAAKGNIQRLRVFVQVNTSGEENKSGVAPGDETLALCRHIREACPHLQLQGLMTIGDLARSQAAASGAQNEDFARLRDERTHIAHTLDLAETELELSMGMSADYEDAIHQGSDEVRVGSTIFGARPPKHSA